MSRCARLFKTNPQPSRSGSALLLTIFLTSLCLMLAVLLFKIIYNTAVTGNALLLREKALWLAEGGLEKGKVEWIHNPSWYSDLPHYPEDDPDWLICSSVGQKDYLGDGAFKVVREKGKNIIYSIGCVKKSIVVLKIEFAPASCHNLTWKEL
jgi:hypothetical protein